MATSRISNTIKGPTGTAVSGVSVSARLMPAAGFRISDFSEVARLVQATTDASGYWYMDLERQSNITPSGSWYEITELIPDAQGGKRVWYIGVGESDQSLLASLVTPAEVQPTVVPAGDVYLTQASADARYQALGSLGSSTPSSIDPDDSGSAGVSTSASRQDHQHQFTTAAPSAALTLLTANSEGVASTSARSDHGHAITWNPPACRVYNSAAISLANNSWQAVTFNSERFDTDTMHSTVSLTERITFHTAGLYVVSGSVEFAANSTGRRGLAIMLNGATFIAIIQVPTCVSPETGIITITTVYKFAANDYVELRANQNTGGALNAQSGGNYSPEFSAVWIGVG